MNKLDFADFKQTVLHHARLRLRLLDWQRRASTFSRGGESDSLPRIYVINLDRRPDRWRRVRRELDRFRDRHGECLSSITRRFSAVDARYMETTPDPALLIPKFTLADQLTVEPNPLMRIDDDTRAREIQMTKQEVAVALSHIEVWKLIVNADVPSALVLEGDVFMNHGFAGELGRTWMSLDHAQDVPSFDLLYLAFQDVGDLALTEQGASLRKLQRPGIWEASGYVLSREGAQKLLEALPVYGPIDLWLNLQFERLRVFSAARPIIEQRIDEPSTNSYSVMPVLSQVGVITREKPLLPKAIRLPGPVVAVGGTDSGLTALATALSMIGYTCCSDIDHLPASEGEALLTGLGRRSFNAYVNVGALDSDALGHIASAHPDARFIATSQRASVHAVEPNRTLWLPPEEKDKWAALTDFLGVEYPALPYPTASDIGMRTLSEPQPTTTARPATDLVADRGPWILSEKRGTRRGISVEPTRNTEALVARVDWASGGRLDEEAWKLRDDTFPSNLALFTTANVSQTDGEAVLVMRPERVTVRDLTSGAIASVASYRYGRFSAELRPPRISGLVTGMFLHRNGPRQEIDIELLGKDTTKMLINVFYNPGSEGTKLEYGYRGTPTLVNLGFDATEDFHTYEIDWQPDAIRWLVDGQTVYERSIWDPTPVPDQPLQFNFNLWHSRSKEFAGRLATAELPASARIRSIEIRTTYPRYLHGLRTGPRWSPGSV